MPLEMLQDITNTSPSAENVSSRKRRKCPLTVLPPVQPSSPSTSAVTPISPTDATVELDSIHQRLQYLAQGMSAWMMQPQSQPQAMTTATARLHAEKKLTVECRRFQKMYQQITTWTTEEQTTEPPRDTPVTPLSSVNLKPDAPTSRRVGGASRSRKPWPPLKPCTVVVVEFKRQRLKRCTAETPVEPGTYVVIPGDRGYDCGLVVQCGQWNPLIEDFERGTLMTMDPDPVPVSRLKGDLGLVMREATAEEIQQLYCEQASKERLALKTCREWVRRLRLDMEVVDCEYQFDGTKISFFFEAARSIDFRELNKELYRIFNARIWLENINNAVKNVVPEGAMSRGDKVQYHRSGLKF